ncbi:hypothetical protein [Peribacillus frigoritolerans]|uniref:hypothetical protein n=1 Tax=Peribacillus frigoritolerans TaxID=450367 RepID=UPI00227E1B48|nr:hypothetical protein [Peribacillus frigoritolerans]MCY9136905.1 hypothetical protein [Peribacillus frigoritolerans]
MGKACPSETRRRIGAEEESGRGGGAPFFLTLLFSIIIIGTSAIWERDYFKVGGDSELDMQHHQYGG